eukprot:TRINITY_DN31336_c0_g1_i1.p1 TRINITY_DN31336_c0_g1~~TRINITY_DN31336_c0_g1_i1.p1  ORF type:complete len:112 (-),score=18.33 TRINITY_DN31336_c0_g1_i1:91-426(-)
MNMTQLFYHSLFACVVVQLLILSESQKFEGVFLGEGVECEGTYASVNLSSETASISNEQKLEAIASAVISSAQNVKNNSTKESVWDAADVSKQFKLDFQVVQKLAGGWLIL